MPALASAGTYTAGLGLGKTSAKDSSSEFKTDGSIGISLFAEKNDVFIDRLSLGLQYQSLGDLKDYDGCTFLLRSFGPYGRYTFINRPYMNGNIFAYAKLGAGIYFAIGDKGGYDAYTTPPDYDGLGMSIGFGGGYAFNQGTAITLSYDYNKMTLTTNYEDDGEFKIKAHVLTLAVQHRFDFSLGFGKASGESETAAWTSSKKSGSDDDNWEAGMNMSDYEKSSGNYKSEKPEESQPKAKPVKVKAETQKTVVSATLQDSGSEIVEPTPKITFGSKIKKAWRNMGRKLPAVKEYQRPASNNSWFGNGWFKVKETEN